MERQGSGYATDAVAVRRRALEHGATPLEAGGPRVIPREGEGPTALRGARSEGRGMVGRMVARPVQLRVGGQSYRVVSSASEEELERLAAAVDEKLTAIVPPGKPLTPQSMLLVAMALAHDVESERRRAEAIRGHSRAALSELLEEVEATLTLADRSLSRASGTSDGGGSAEAE